MVDITPFDVRPTSIEGLLVCTIKQVHDERGTVREFFRASALAEALDQHGIAPVGPWQQVNVTETRLGGLRGMHGEAMHKLVAVVAGKAFGAYVDTRPGSSTYGAVETVSLVPGVQVFVPAGVCNGFQVVEDRTQYLYCFDREWEPGMPGVAITPLDPALGIEWPVPVDVDDPAMLSAKDRDAPTLASLPSPS